MLIIQFLNKISEVDHTGGTPVITPTDHPKSVCNRCLTEFFCNISVFGDRNLICSFMDSTDSNFTEIGKNIMCWTWISFFLKFQGIVTGFNFYCHFIYNY